MVAIGEACVLEVSFEVFIEPLVGNFLLCIWPDMRACLLTLSTLINVMALINHVGRQFCQNIKRGGLNKRGRALENSVILNKCVGCIFFQTLWVSRRWSIKVYILFPLFSNFTHMTLSGARGHYP